MKGHLRIAWARDDSLGVAALWMEERDGSWRLAFTAPGCSGTGPRRGVH